MTTPSGIQDPNVAPSPTTVPPVVPVTPVETPPVETPTLESRTAEVQELTERLKNTRAYGDEQKNRADGFERTITEFGNNPASPIPSTDDAAMAKELARLHGLENQMVKDQLQKTYGLSDEVMETVKGSDPAAINSEVMALALQHIAAGGQLGVPAPVAATTPPTTSTPPATPPIGGLTSIPAASPTANNQVADKPVLDTAREVMDNLAGRK